MKRAVLAAIFCSLSAFPAAIAAQEPNVFTPDTYQGGILRLLAELPPDDSPARASRVPVFRWPTNPIGQERKSRWTLDYKALRHFISEPSPERIAGTGNAVYDTEIHVDLEITFTHQGAGRWSSVMRATGVGKRTCLKEAVSWRQIHWDGWERRDYPSLSHTTTASFQLEGAHGPRIQRDELDETASVVLSLRSQKQGDERKRYEVVITSVMDDETYTTSQKRWFTCEHPFFPLWRVELSEGVQDFSSPELNSTNRITVRKVSGTGCDGCGADSQCLRSRCDSLVGCIEWKGSGRCDPGDECYDAFCKDGVCEKTEEKLAFAECEEQLLDIYQRCRQLDDWQIIIDRSDAADPTIICPNPDCTPATPGGSSGAGDLFVAYSFNTDRTCTDTDDHDACQISCVGTPP